MIDRESDTLNPADGSTVVMFTLPPSTPVGRGPVEEVAINGEYWVPRRVADAANARANLLQRELEEARVDMQKLVGRMASAMEMAK